MKTWIVKFCYSAFIFISSDYLHQEKKKRVMGARMQKVRDDQWIEKEGEGRVDEEKRTDRREEGHIDRWMQKKKLTEGCRKN